MADGLGNLTLTDARRLAEKRFEALDGLHGDPSKNASWIKERQLAEIVIALVDRIEAARASLDGGVTAVDRDEFARRADVLRNETTRLRRLLSEALQACRECDPHDSHQDVRDRIASEAGL